MVPAQARLLYESALGLPSTLEVDRLDLILLHTLLHQSDPTGDDRVKPLVPGVDARYEIHLGNERIYRRAFDYTIQAMVNPTIDLLKREYESVYLDVLDGRLSPDLHRRMLHHWVAKYNLPYRTFQSNRVPDETPITPQTSLSETFNQADSTTLGPVLTWAETDGNSITVNNEYRTGSQVLHRVRAEHDLSSSDHYVQADVKFVGGTEVGDIAGGVTARTSTSTVGFYLAHAHWNTDQSIQAYSVVGGVFTLIAENIPITPTANVYEKLRLTCNGSTISGLHKGIQKFSVTDTAIATGVRGGMRHLHSQAEDNTIYIAADNFLATDVLGLMGAVSTITEGAGGGSVTVGAATTTTAGQTNRSARYVLVSLGVINDGDPPTPGPNLLRIPPWVVRELAQEAAFEESDNDLYSAIVGTLPAVDSAPLVYD